ncbi:MAG: RNA polymerase sigma factor [Oscillospiraceae bacterium]|nr:RNA polymerase sigma factor [Oscillospiraceae bacterium]
MTPEHETLIEHLFKEYHRFLCISAYEVLQDWMLAEDAVQRTFEIACQKEEILDTLERPRLWLTQILRNVVKNMWRAQKTQNKYFEELSPEREDSLPDYRNVEDDINYLKPRHISQEDFNIFKSVVIYGFTCAQVAEYFGLSEAACYKRVQRTKKKMQKFFEREK